ncbi:unnamed protein product [Gadus morhua 'NCC']
MDRSQSPEHEVHSCTTMDSTTVLTHLHSIIPSVKDSPAFVGLDVGQRLSSTAGAVGRRLGKCHYQVNTTTTNRTSSGNPFLSNSIPTPGNEAEEK